MLNFKICFRIKKVVLVTILCFSSGYLGGVENNCFIAINPRADLLWSEGDYLGLYLWINWSV